MTTSVRFCLSYDRFKLDFIVFKVDIISVENTKLSRMEGRKGHNSVLLFYL